MQPRPALLRLDSLNPALARSTKSRRANKPAELSGIRLDKAKNIVDFNNRENVARGEIIDAWQYWYQRAHDKYEYCNRKGGLKKLFKRN